jgi:hypothetical protein
MLGFEYISHPLLFYLAMEAQPASENSYVFNKMGRRQLRMLTCLTANMNVLCTIRAQAAELSRIMPLSSGF